MFKIDDARESLQRLSGNPLGNNAFPTSGGYGRQAIFAQGASGALVRKSKSWAPASIVDAPDSVDRFPDYGHGTGADNPVISIKPDRL
jgi:hypothetical protein